MDAKSGQYRWLCMQWRHAASVKTENLYYVGFGILIKNSKLSRRNSKHSSISNGTNPRFVAKFRTDRLRTVDESRAEKNLKK